MTLSAVILAGGESRRMGKDKAFLTVAGQTLIQRMIATAQEAGAQAVLVSGRAGQTYPKVGVPVLYDREPGLGPLAGMERALDTITSDLLLVLAVDLGMIQVRVLAQMLNHCDRLTGVVPSLPEGLQPLAAVYPRRCAEIARGCLAHRRLAAREFAESCLRERAVRRWRVPAHDAAAFANWNEPSDLPRQGL